jgi:hypothetical protein
MVGIRDNLDFVLTNGDSLQYYIFINIAVIQLTTMQIHSSLRGLSMSKVSKNKILTVALGSLILFTSTNMMAGEKWKENHPRREQVNDRLNNQNKRIHQEVKEGEMTKQEASKLHKEDKQIRQEEKSMAAQNGGHITKQEQQTLNQQENAVSKEIGK